MNIEAHRKNIIHRILEIESEAVLTKIDTLLQDEGYIYTVEGELLTESEFRKQVIKILQVSENEDVYTTAELKKKILNK